MAIFKDIKDVDYAQVRPDDYMTDDEIQEYNWKKEQMEIEKMKDTINVLNRRLKSDYKGEINPQTYQYLQERGLDTPMTDDEIQAQIGVVQSDMNRAQAQWDYMMRTTDTPFKRNIKADTMQVLYDVAQPTDMGDVASLVRIGGFWANFLMGSSATTPLMTAMKLEGAVTTIETTADMLRMKSEGKAITPLHVIGHATKNQAINMMAYGLGRGFKNLVDTANGKAEIESLTSFVEERQAQQVALASLDPSMAKFDYQEVVFDAVDQANNYAGYSKQAFQTGKGVALNNVEDAWRTGGQLDEVLSNSTLRKVAEVGEEGDITFKVTNEGGTLEATVKSTEELKPEAVRRIGRSQMGRILTPDEIRKFQITNEISLSKPLDEDGIRTLARMMEADPSIKIDPRTPITLDSTNSNYTIRAINKKRLEWIGAGRYDLAKQDTRAVQKAIRLDSAKARYEMMSPQFRKIIQRVNTGQYHKLNKVQNIGVDERNIVDLVYDDLASLDFHFKKSAEELNNMIGKYGGAHGVNNMLDLMLYGDKNGIDIVQAMYDPRYTDGWMRDIMTSVHEQLGAMRGMQVRSVREIVPDDEIYKQVQKFGLGELLEESPFINAEGVNKFVVSSKFTPEYLQQLKGEKLTLMEKKHATDLMESFFKEDVIPHNLAVEFSKKAKAKGLQKSPKKMLAMTQKEFKKYIQDVMGKGSKGQAKFTKMFNKIRADYYHEMQDLSATIKDIGRQQVIANSKLETLPKFMNKEVLMGEGYDLLADYGGGVQQQLKRVPWEEMTDLQKETFNLTIRPDMKRAFKEVDISANEKAYIIKGLDTRTATVEDMWKAKPELEGDLQRTVGYMQKQQKRKMGEILLQRYGDVSDQELFDIYSQKYGLPHLTVKYINDPNVKANAYIMFDGQSPTGFVVNTPHFNNYDRASQLSIIRHEIEHVIDIQRYGISGGARGNIPSLFGNIPEDLFKAGKMSEFEGAKFNYSANLGFDKNAKRVEDFITRHTEMNFSKDTNLDELMRYFYDDHFYNYATDSFENSYVKHTADYLTKKYQADNLYYDFLNDVRNSTELRGRQINMTEMMHKYFDNRSEFENFMLKHGGGREVASSNLTTLTRVDGEMRALGATRQQYVASFSKANLDKMQKTGEIGFYQGKGVGRGVEVDSDMIHLFRQYTNKLEGMWLNDRLTKFAGERFTDQNMGTKVITNMILGNGGIKQTITAPYQMVERMMMGGRVGEGMKEMIRQTGMAFGNYGKLNVYNMANLMEGMTRLSTNSDVEGFFTMNLAKKMRKFADSTNLQAEGVEDLFLLRQMMREMYGIQSGASPAGWWKKADQYFARNLSTQEFYDTYANYTATKWVLDDFKQILDVDDYAKLTPLQQRMLGRGGYIEENWKEGQRALAQYSEADGYNFEKAMVENKQIENMINTGKGYYNRTDVARKMAKVDAESKDFRYLMRTTMGLAVNSWRETMTAVDGGILTPVKVGSREGATILAQRAGFLGLAGGGALGSYKFIRGMEKALRTRDMQAMNWQRQIASADRDPEWYARRGLDLLDYTGLSVYLVDPRSITAVGTAKNETLRMLGKIGNSNPYVQDDDSPVDDVFKVAFSVVLGSTAMSRYTMLRGSDKEKEAQMQDYYKSGQFNRDVRRNFNRHGLDISKNFLNQYNQNTRAMKSVQ